MRGFRTILCIIVGLVCAAPSGRSVRTARAAAPRAAEALFREGLARLKDRRYAEALQRFEESYALAASPNSRYQQGRCHRALGHLGRAYQLYLKTASEAQDLAATTGDERYRRTMADALREARELEPRVPRLVLQVPGGLPEDTEVLVDSDKVPSANYGKPWEVDPGERQVLLTGARLKPVLLKVTAREGELHRVDLAPERLPTATVVLTVPVRPAGLVVTLDDQPLPLGRVERPTYLDVGEHRLKAEAPGFVTFRWRQRLGDGDVARVPVKLELAQGTPRVAFFAMAAAALVGTGIGVGFLASATGLDAQERAKADAAALGQGPWPDPAVRDQVRSQALVMKIGFAVGGSFAAAAAVLAFTTRWRTSTDERGRALQLRPVVSGSAQGLLLEGRF